MILADTSALVHAYLPDEEHHEELRAIMRTGDSTIGASELAAVEFTSAVRRAGRAGRLRDPDVVLRRFDADSGQRGIIGLIGLDTAAVFPRARWLLDRFPLATLDAIHVAAALTEHIGRDDVVFLTADRRQASVAREVGLAVRTPG